MTIEDIRNAVKVVAAEYPISRAVLFGSRANGTSTDDSDVDLIMEFSKPITLITLSLITERLEEILKTDIDPNSKAVYQYRLAKLYFYDNNRDKAKYYLNEAKNNTSDSNAKKKIDSLLNGNWKHL